MAHILLHGDPVETIGHLPEVGTTIRDFDLISTDLQFKNKQDFAGKNIIFNIFPSVDTGVCAIAAKKFNDKAGKLDDAVVLNVSKDLPFAMKRFADQENLSNVVMLSAYRGNFGKDYGVEMVDSPMHGLLSRAVIVADQDGKVIYTEQVPEISDEPDYDKALDALK